MDYKKIIRNRSTRFAILHLLRWVPDSMMLRVQYKMKTGRWPNLKHPTRYTEKLQLYKMRYRNPIMAQCVDKYDVREYVKNKNLGRILTQLYGVYETPKEIDFDKLPDEFVIKTTSGGGGINVIVVKNKKNVNFNAILHDIGSWLNYSSMQVNAGREWAYSGIKNTRIIIEELLKDTSKYGLCDYKFFCFNGEPKFLYVVTDRKPGEYAFLGVYDINFNKLPVYRCDERRAEYTVTKPKNYDEMIEVARKLSADFPHVRVDLYNVDGKIYFGELTFYDGSGYFHYDPDTFDIQVGSYFTTY